MSGARAETGHDKIQVAIVVAITDREALPKPRCGYTGRAPNVREGQIAVVSEHLQRGWLLIHVIAVRDEQIGELILIIMSEGCRAGSKIGIRAGGGTDVLEREVAVVELKSVFELPACGQARGRPKAGNEHIDE